MVDNSDQPTQLHAFPEEGDHGREEGTMDYHAARKPFALRVRMIIMLSLICWGALIATLAWILS